MGFTICPQTLDSTEDKLHLSQDVQTTLINQLSVNYFDIHPIGLSYFIKSQFSDSSF